VENDASEDRFGQFFSKEVLSSSKEQKKIEKTARYIRCIARMCQCNSCESTHLPHSYAHGARISASLPRELLLLQPRKRVNSHRRRSSDEIPRFEISRACVCAVILSDGPKVPLFYLILAAAAGEKDEEGQQGQQGQGERQKIAVQQRARRRSRDCASASLARAAAPLFDTQYCQCCADCRAE